MEDQHVKVMDAARTIGLTATNDEVTGTIDEIKVLDVLAALAQADPDHADLFRDAATRVQRSRSAGVELIDVQHALDPGTAAVVQLRYRSEMADVFTDLAIDVGMRQMAIEAPA